MSNAEIQAAMEAALKPHYLAFMRSPGQATLTVNVTSSDASGALQVVQSDKSRIINKGLKPHFSAVLNRLAENFNRNGLGIQLNP